MANHKRILVLESEKLMSAGIFSLLASQPELEVFKTTAVSLGASDYSESLDADVVILDEELLAENILAVTQMVNRHHNLRLIVFGLRDTNIQIFDKQLIRVESSRDFFNLIEAEQLRQN